MHKNHPHFLDIKMDITPKYVRDNRNGNIYPYHRSMDARIDKTLVFCEPPTVDPILKSYMSRMFNTMEELREACNKIALNLPYDTPIARAAEMYTQRVIYLYDRKALPEQIAQDTQPIQEIKPAVKPTLPTK